MRQKATRMPYSCQLQLGRSGICGAPCGGVITMRAMGRDRSQSSSDNTGHTTRRMPSGNFSGGRPSMGWKARRSRGCMGVSCAAGGGWRMIEASAGCVNAPSRLDVALSCRWTGARQRRARLDFAERLRTLHFAAGSHRGLHGAGRKTLSAAKIFSTLALNRPSPKRSSPSRGRWPMKPHACWLIWSRAGGRSSR